MADVARFALSNMAQRIITAAVVAPVIVAAVLIGGLPFMLVVILVAILGVIEFYILAHNRSSQGSTLIGLPTLIGVILALYLGNPVLLILALLIGALATFTLETVRHRADVRRSLVQVAMTLAGVAYLGLPTGFLINLRALPDGAVWILLILCVTWGTDSFAYIGGRLLGKTPLAPKLSPKKTVEGALIGVAGGIGCGLLLLAFTNGLSLAPLAVILVGPFVAILGDLFESALKRFFQAKDSHVAGLDILPGHGGILDRIDALLLVSVFAYFAFMLLGLRS